MWLRQKICKSIAIALFLGNPVFSFTQQKPHTIATATSFLKISDSLYEAANYQSMAYYDSLALQIGNKLKNPLIIGNAYFQQGKHFLATEKYKQSIQSYQYALDHYFEEIKDGTTAAIYNDIGTNEGELGNFDSQINWFLKAIRLYEKLDNEVGLAQAYSNISKAYFDAENDELAFDYAEKALLIRNKTGDPEALALSYCNIANMYATVGNKAQANNYFDIGLKYAEKSGNKSRLAQAYITKSLLLNMDKKMAEALDYEIKAIDIYEELGDYGMVANRSIAVAFYSNVLKNKEQATKYYDRAETLAKSIGNRLVLKNVYAYKANFYKDHKDFEKALEYQEKFVTLRDSILNKETAAKIATLQGEFNLEKKDFEINKLQIDQRIKNLEIEKQKALIYKNFAEAEKKQNEIDLLNKTKLLQEESLMRKQKELDNQNLKITNNQQQLKIVNQQKEFREKQLSNQRLLRNLLMGVLFLVLLLGALFINRLKLKKKIDQQASLLKMRNTISEDLHDDIGASLSNINILNKLAQNNFENKEKLTEYLLKAEDDIQHVSESISDIVWNINPKYDTLGNLLVRMKRYAADMMDGKNMDYEINFTEPEENVSLDMDKRRNFYLLFKEAVNNLTKYSKAKMVKINVNIRNNVLDLQIQDNGVGFDVLKEQTGIGITNMRKRAYELNGKIHIDSAPGKGTSIHLQFPIT